MQTGTQFKNDQMLTKTIEDEEVLPNMRCETKGGEEKTIEQKHEGIQTEKSNKALAIDQKTGQIVAKDSSELMRQIAILMKGQAFPQTMDTPAKCLAAWNLACSFKNISPQRAISCMMYLNGVLTIFGELPRTLAENTGELEDCRLFVVGEDYREICFENKNLFEDPFAAVCRMKRKGKSMNEYFFTTKEAEKAGLLSRRGPWQTYAKIMLKRRAMAEALKFEFSDALMGAAIAEYTFNHFPDTEPRDVTRQGEVVEKAADKLNQIFENH